MKQAERIIEYRVDACTTGGGFFADCEGLPQSLAWAETPFAALMKSVELFAFAMKKVDARMKF